MRINNLFQSFFLDPQGKSALEATDLKSWRDKKTKLQDFEQNVVKFDLTSQS